MYLTVEPKRFLSVDVVMKKDGFYSSQPPRYGSGPTAFNRTNDRSTAKVGIWPLLGIIELLKILKSNCQLVGTTKWYEYTNMGVGRGSLCLSPGFWKFEQKKVVFLVSNGKKQISPLLAPPPRNNFSKNPLVPPLKKILPTPIYNEIHFFKTFPIAKHHNSSWTSSKRLHRSNIYIVWLV